MRHAHEAGLRLPVFAFATVTNPERAIVRQLALLELLRADLPRTGGGVGRWSRASQESQKTEGREESHASSGPDHDRTPMSRKSATLVEVMGRLTVPLRFGVAALLTASSIALVSACAREDTGSLSGADARADRDGAEGAEGAEGADGAQGDGGVQDADAGLDGSVGDAAVLPICSVSSSVASPFSVQRFDEQGRALMLQDTGGEPERYDATLIELQPASFALDDGTLLRLGVWSSSWIADQELGSRFVLWLEVFRPFWTEVRVVLTDRNTGRFRGALWDGSSWSSLVREDVEVRHEPADCRHDDAWGCGEQVGLRLSVRGGTGELELNPRQAYEDAGWLAANGQSGRYVEGPFCTDTPREWYAGFIWRRRVIDDCGVLSRDACIASPDCALHGSETRDPGYACYPASTVCERLDALGCRARSGLCRPDAGECYCPEDQLCGCGGGPPPICRRRCDPRTDEVSCAEDYFCELSRREGAEACTPSFDEGRCVRVPDDCAGTPPLAVCGCPEVSTDGEPVEFAHDCGRRRARAFSVADDACTP